MTKSYDYYRVYKNDANEIIKMEKVESRPFGDQLQILTEGTFYKNIDQDTQNSSELVETLVSFDLIRCLNQWWNNTEGTSIHDFVIYLRQIGVVAPVECIPIILKMPDPKLWHLKE